MSGPFGQNDRRDLPESQIDHTPSPGSRLLEQILQATSGDTPSAGFVEASDAQALESTAQRLGVQPFCLDPVALELVHAMVEVQFKKADIPLDALRAISDQIATTLYDDPPSRQRLEALWLELTER